MGLLGNRASQLVFRSTTNYRDYHRKQSSNRRSAFLYCCSLRHDFDLPGPGKTNGLAIHSGEAMTYSDIALNAVVVAVLVDLFLLRTQMMTKGIFWLTYTLILPFQLLTNWWLTSKSIVMYSNDQIIGRRLAGAPIEDLLFGFSLILFTLAVWNFLHIRRISLAKKKIY